MQKKAIPIAIAAGAVVAMFFIARITGVLQFYKVSSNSSLPTQSIGQLILSSNLPSVERNRFIFFEQFDSILQKEATWFHRCVGMPGDTLWMKNGVLFVNGQQGTIENKVWRLYTLRTDRAAYWIDQYKDRFDEATLQWMNLTDTIINVSLTLSDAARVQSTLQASEWLALVDVSNYTPDYFVQLQQSHWTLDNFGPLVVPEDSYFVLGDNRHNAQDSRFIGPIDESKLSGVLLSNK